MRFDETLAINHPVVFRPSIPDPVPVYPQGRVPYVHDMYLYTPIKIKKQKKLH